MFIKVVEPTARYTMEVDVDAKILRSKVSGTYTPEDAANFVAAYNKALSMIVPSETVFEIDCYELTTQSDDMASELQAVFMLYKNTGFKEVILRGSENPAHFVQMKNLARQIGAKFTFIK